MWQVTFYERGRRWTEVFGHEADARACARSEQLKILDAATDAQLKEAIVEVYGRFVPLPSNIDDHIAHGRVDSHIRNIATVLRPHAHWEIAELAA